MANKVSLFLLVLVCSVTMCKNSILSWTYSWTIWTLVWRVHMFRVDVVIYFLFGIVTKCATRLCTFVFPFFNVMKHFGFNYFFERIKTKYIKTWILIQRRYIIVIRFGHFLILMLEGHMVFQCIASFKWFSTHWTKMTISGYVNLCMIPYMLLSFGNLATFKTIPGISAISDHIWY